MKITRENATVNVTLESSTGWPWTFSHTRHSNADAANLLTLIEQQQANERQNDIDRHTYKDREIARLTHSNAALRGHLRRAKRKGTP